MRLNLQTSPFRLKVRTRVLDPAFSSQPSAYLPQISAGSVNVFEYWCKFWDSFQNLQIRARNCANVATKCVTPLFLDQELDMFWLTEGLKTDGKEIIQCKHLELLFLL